MTTEIEKRMCILVSNVGKRLGLPWDCFCNATDDTFTRTLDVLPISDFRCDLRIADYIDAAVENQLRKDGR